MQCYWHELGQVEQPGEYEVNGIDTAVVSVRDIKAVSIRGGNPLLLLQNGARIAEPAPRYWIVKRQFAPKGPE